MVVESMSENSVMEESGLLEVRLQFTGGGDFVNRIVVWMSDVELS